VGDSEVITDCRGRESVLVSRKGGDFELRFTDENGKTEFVIWMEMRKPYKQTYEKIVKLFTDLENHLVIQNPQSVHEPLNSRET
jgi:hypothetical protein